MYTLTANEAKTHFGETLMKAQRSHVEITRNGKSVAFIVSSEEYQLLEAFKNQYLKDQIAQGLKDIEENNTVDGEKAFEELLGR